MTQSKVSAIKPENNGAKKTDSFDLLDITASLGYQTYRRNGRNSWSKEDDDELLSLINEALKEIGYPNGIVDIRTVQESIKIIKLIQWDVLCSKFSNKSRTAKDLRKRWSGSLDPNVKKGRWTKEEDALLLKSYEKHGAHWLSVSMEIAGRTEDQCAKRYVEVLGPSSKGRLREWSQEEDLLLISKVKKYGTKWRQISSEMEFRPSLTCRNRWRKIITMVVRNQAPDIIMTAVKENKELDLDNAKSKVEKAAQKEQENKMKSGSSKADKIRKDESTTNSPKADNIKTVAKSTDMKTKLPEERPSSPVPSISVPTPLTFSANSLPPLPAIPTVPTRILPLNHRPMTEARNSPLSGVISDNNMLRTGGFHSHSQPNLQNKIPTTMVTTNRSTTSDNHNDSSYQYSSTNKETGLITTNNYNTTTTNTTNNDNINKNNDKAVPDTNNITKKSLPLPSASQTEWKFVLKDGKGLSISNGTISTSGLVQELIEQAKKYSLKISLHQHIHHHYNSNTATSKHTEFEPPAPSLISHFQKHQDIPTNHTSPSISSTNLSNIQNSLFPDLVDRTLQNFTTDEANSKMGFIPNRDLDKSRYYGLNVSSQGGPFSPTYNQLGLELSPSPLPGNNLINDINDQFTTAGNPRPANINNDSGITNDNTNPHNSNNNNDSVGNDNDTIYFPSSNAASNATQTQQGTSSNSNTSSYVTSTAINSGTGTNESNTNRSSHFNYLPPTIRPQLESSDVQHHSSRNESLSKLLNPSPRSGSNAINNSSPSPGSTSSSSQQKRKRKRRRTRSNSNNSTMGNGRPLVKVRTGSMHSSSRGRAESIANVNNTISSSSPGTHEDGVDFWETLRSLADNPAIKGDDNAISNVNVQQEISSLFDHDKRPKNELVKANTVEKKINLDEHAVHSDNDNVDPQLPLNAS